MEGWTGFYLEISEGWNVILFFNRFVFESFFGVETAGNYVTLCVDEKCLQDFCRQENMALEDFYRDIEHSVLFKEDWGWVEKEIEAEIPLFLGLIVLQVLLLIRCGRGSDGENCDGKSL